MSNPILVRVKLTGNGTNENAYGANLPTYVNLKSDVVDGYAIVSVPLDTLGLTEDDLRGEVAHPTQDGPLYMVLSNDNLQKAQAHLDKAYPGKAHAIELVSG